MDRKLRLLLEDNPEMIESRSRLRAIIKAYEKLHWSKESDVDEIRIKENDIAESIAEQERIFLEARKNIIKQNLSQFKMTQQDLGLLLGHGKTYMSELMNGISPFGMRDLIVVHRLFQIELENLIPTIISQKDRIRIKASIDRLNNPMIKLEKEDLLFARSNLSSNLWH
ncbi:MAG: transcriptional regulator [Saprospiraceae bacterium]